ncbi:MAG: hypothetical protein AAB554_02370 [Patescibacteria group bacterium]
MKTAGVRDPDLIVVFGTTAIISERPAYPGQTPVYAQECPKHGYRLWSTGKLERAIGEGRAVFVCTVIPIFRPEDDWWRALVAADRIYRPVGDARGSAEQVFDHFINDPWRRFLADIGRPWPEGVDDALAWRETLDGSDGLLYGGHLVGFAGSA